MLSQVDRGIPSSRASSPVFSEVGMPMIFSPSEPGVPELLPPVPPWTAAQPHDHAVLHECRGGSAAASFDGFGSERAAIVFTLPRSAGPCGVRFSMPHPTPRDAWRSTHGPPCVPKSGRGTPRVRAPQDQTLVRRFLARTAGSIDFHSAMARVRRRRDKDTPPTIRAAPHADVDPGVSSSFRRFPANWNATHRR